MLWTDISDVAYMAGATHVQSGRNGWWWVKFNNEESMDDFLVHCADCGWTLRALSQYGLLCRPMP